ncbi:hypothetical protein N7468_008956 [Penicillium chermesinum]|uniref:Uncharacterized protein n=1 Tax=Penicillium chermesinum TaxID=63820 RepID=A0A9W9TED8_9EURO|nr:uncharacterized protein N7468_008956 [Penicillium chermesinum]KAJ5219752.1 hypothetical protein N7468_008956 [Penicillium chermesinum]
MVDQLHCSGTVEVAMNIPVHPRLSRKVTGSMLQVLQGTEMAELKRKAGKTCALHPSHQAPPESVLTH